MEKVGNGGGWGDGGRGGVNVSRGKDREEGGVVRSILWPASSSIPLNYCFILPLMRWDLFLQHSSLLWLYMCVSACVYVWSTYDWINTLQSGFLSPPFRLSLFMSFHPSVSSIFHFLSFSISASVKNNCDPSASQMSTRVRACVCPVHVERCVKMHWLSLCTFACS